MNILNVKGDLSFITARQQRENIIKFIAAQQTKEITLNLAEVTHSDSAGVALLIEILRSAAKLGKVIILQQLPNQMRALIEFCNLSTVLNTGAVQHAQ